MPVESIEEAIRVHALDDAYLVSMIDQRWYGPVLEQGGALPAVTVQLISSTDEAPTQLGHSGLERARVQFTVWSSCQLKLVRVAAAITRVGFFDGFRGVMGGPGGLYVGRCSAVNRGVDLGREPGRNAYKRAIDFYFVYRIV